MRESNEGEDGDGESTGEAESAPGERRATGTDERRPPEPDGSTVTVRVVGEGTREVRIDPDATCADLLRAVGLSPHTATALADGRPVPSDARVTDDEIRVLRLVKGG